MSGPEWQGLLKWSLSYCERMELACEALDEPTLAELLVGYFEYLLEMTSLGGADAGCTFTMTVRSRPLGAAAVEASARGQLRCRAEFRIPKTRWVGGCPHRR